MNFPKSTNVSSADYDSAKQTLTVHYKSGGSYIYHDVDAKHWHGLQQAESIGSYLHKHVKHAHKAERVEKDDAA